MMVLITIVSIEMPTKSHTKTMKQGLALLSEQQKIQIKPVMTKIVYMQIPVSASMLFNL